MANDHQKHISKRLQWVGYGSTNTHIGSFTFVNHVPLNNMNASSEYGVVVPFLILSLNIVTKLVKENEFQ